MKFLTNPLSYNDIQELLLDSEEKNFCYYIKYENNVLNLEKNIIPLIIEDNFFNIGFNISSISVVEAKFDNLILKIEISFYKTGIPAPGN